MPAHSCVIQASVCVCYMHEMHWHHATHKEIESEINTLCNMESWPLWILAKLNQNMEMKHRLPQRWVTKWERERKKNGAHHHRRYRHWMPRWVHHRTIEWNKPKHMANHTDALVWRLFDTRRFNMYSELITKSRLFRRINKQMQIIFIDYFLAAVFLFFFFIVIIIIVIVVVNVAIHTAMNFTLPSETSFVSRYSYKNGDEWETEQRRRRNKKRRAETKAEAEAETDTQTVVFIWQDQSPPHWGQKFWWQ